MSFVLGLEASVSLFCCRTRSKFDSAVVRRRTLLFWLTFSFFVRVTKLLKLNKIYGWHSRPTGQVCVKQKKNLNEVCEITLIKITIIIQEPTVFRKFHRFFWKISGFSENFFGCSVIFSVFIWIYRIFRDFPEFSDNSPGFS